MAVPPYEKNREGREGHRGFLKRTLDKAVDIATLGPIRRHPIKSAFIIAALLGVGSKMNAFLPGSNLDAAGKFSLKGYEKGKDMVGSLLKTDQGKWISEQAKPGMSFLKRNARNLGFNVNPS